MADKIKDTEDRRLESLFQSDSIADDGFSKRVVKRIRRQMWLRRLSLPVAMLIGAAIAVKPVTQLFAVGSQVLGSIPQETFAGSAALLSQLPLILVTGVLLAIAMLTFRMLEE